MASLFADENVPYPVVLKLRAMGDDVITAFEAGLANSGLADEDILVFATKNQRAVLTNNRRDYHRLHRKYPQHAGIITYTHDPDRAALATRIHQAIDGQDLTDRLVKVLRPA